VQSASRLGFKGSENLGEGYSANFKLEAGIEISDGTSTQGGRVFGRHTSVGLAGPFGAVDVGRFFNIITNAMIADPFGSGHEGAYTNIINFAYRTSNAIYYTSPNVAGFTAELSYGFGEVPGNSSANRDIGAAIGYASGPFAIKFAHEDTQNETGTNALRISNVNATYDFHVARVGIAYNVNRDDIHIDSYDCLIGASVPMRNGTFMVSYIRHKDRTAAAQDASQAAIGYTYALSKRTSFYTSYARIVNRNGASFTVGNMTDAGSGTKGMAAGITHRF
jgi:predicted porin